MAKDKAVIPVTLDATELLRSVSKMQSILEAAIKKSTAAASGTGTGGAKTQEKQSKVEQQLDTNVRRLSDAYKSLAVFHERSLGRANTRRERLNRASGLERRAILRSGKQIVRATNARARMDQAVSDAKRREIKAIEAVSARLREMMSGAPVGTGKAAVAAPIPAGAAPTTRPVSNVPVPGAKGAPAPIPTPVVAPTPTPTPGVGVGPTMPVTAARGVKVTQVTTKTTKEAIDVGAEAVRLRPEGGQAVVRQITEGEEGVVTTTTAQTRSAAEQTRRNVRAETLRNRRRAAWERQLTRDVSLAEKTEGQVQAPVNIPFTKRRREEAETIKKQIEDEAKEAKADAAQAKRDARARTLRRRRARTKEAQRLKDYDLVQEVSPTLVPPLTEPLTRGLREHLERKRALQREQAAEEKKQEKADAAQAKRDARARTLRRRRARQKQQQLEKDRDLVTEVYPLAPPLQQPLTRARRELAEEKRDILREQATQEKKADKDAAAQAKRDARARTLRRRRAEQKQRLFDKDVVLAEQAGIAGPVGGVPFTRQRREQLTAIRQQQIADSRDLKEQQSRSAKARVLRRRRQQRIDRDLATDVELAGDLGIAAPVGGIPFTRRRREELARQRRQQTQQKSRERAGGMETSRFAMGAAGAATGLMMPTGGFSALTVGFAFMSGPAAGSAAAAAVFIRALFDGTAALNRFQDSLAEAAIAVGAVSDAFKKQQHIADARKAVQGTLVTEQRMRRMQQWDALMQKNMQTFTGLNEAWGQFRMDLTTLGVNMAEWLTTSGGREDSAGKNIAGFVGARLGFLREPLMLANPVTAWIASSRGKAYGRSLFERGEAESALRGPAIAEARRNLNRENFRSQMIAPEDFYNKISTSLLSSKRDEDKEMKRILDRQLAEQQEQSRLTLLLLQSTDKGRELLEEARQRRDELDATVPKYK